MVRIGILVSGGGTNLQAIIDSRLFGEIPNSEIAAVISSNPDAYALTRAKSAGIDSFVVDREIFPNEGSFNEAIIKKLHDLDIELVVLAGFPHVLDKAIVEKYKNRIINIHPSLLPSFACGKAKELIPHEMAIKEGVKISGATAYFVTEKLNSGPIILQKAVEVSQDDTAITLQSKVMREAEWSILPRAIALYCIGALEVSGEKVKIIGEIQ